MQMKFIPALAAAVATSGVLGLANSASAVTLTQPVVTAPIAQTETPFAQTDTPPNPITLPGFTPELVTTPGLVAEGGLLSQVFLGLDGVLSGSVTVSNPTTGALNVNGLAILNSNLDVYKDGNPVLGVTFNGNVPGFTPQAVAPGATVTFPFSVSASDLPDGTLKLFCDKPDQTCLDMFTSGPVEFTSEANAFVTALTQAGLTQTSTAFASGTVKLQYVQHNRACTPADAGIPNCDETTPEPGTLLGLGMLALGGLTGKVASRRKS